MKVQTTSAHHDLPYDIFGISMACICFALCKSCILSSAILRAESKGQSGCSHVCAPNKSFASVWHLPWDFSEPKCQNRVSIQAAAKPTVGHTPAPSLATVQCRIEMYVVQYPQKWYQIEALNVIIEIYDHNYM